MSQARASATLRVWTLLATAVSASVCDAAEELSSSNSLPLPRPPLPEMPPGFWEQYGAWVIVGGIIAVAIVVLLVIQARRARPAVVVPPQVEARRELQSLRGRPENGALLSKVSQVMRHYIASAFGLPPDEMTTAEFTQALASQREAGPDLSNKVSDFLRQCDERKFAPVSQTPLPVSQQKPAGTVATALGLVDLAEARRAALAQEQQRAESARTEQGAKNA